MNKHRLITTATGLSCELDLLSQEFYPGVIPNTTFQLKGCKKLLKGDSRSNAGKYLNFYGSRLFSVLNHNLKHSEVRRIFSDSQGVFWGVMPREPLQQKVASFQLQPIMLNL